MAKSISSSSSPTLTAGAYPDIPIHSDNKDIDKDRHGSGSGSGSKRMEIIRILTCTQNTSALLFSVFLTVHLSSPVMALIGGISAADKTMMIARDLYLPLEPILIYIPLSIHIVSSITKRIIIPRPHPRPSSSSPSSSVLSRLKRYLPRQTHQILAYPLLLLIIPHIFTHRLIPSSSIPPIRELSPSELSWEFVGYNLSTRPITYLSYAALIYTATWHSLVGSMKVISWLKTLRKPIAPDNIKASTSTSTSPPTPRTSISSKRKFGLRSFVLAFTGLITLGLVRVANASHPSLGIISPVMKKRYEAVLSAPWSLAWR